MAERRDKMSLVRARERDMATHHHITVNVGGVKTRDDWSPEAREAAAKSRKEHAKAPTADAPMAAALHKGHLEHAAGHRTQALQGGPNQKHHEQAADKHEQAAGHYAEAAKAGYKGDAKSENTHFRKGAFPARHAETIERTKKISSGSDAPAGSQQVSVIKKKMSETK